MKNPFCLTTSIEQSWMKAANNTVLYQFVVHLHDERRNTIVEIARGDLYESPEHAAASIPAVLADKQLYERAVERAIERVNSDPCEVFASFAFNRGELRSVQHGETYELGMLHAIPIVENPAIGMEVFFNSGAALDAAHHDASLCGVAAIVRCKAGNVEDVEGVYLTDALIPLKVEYIVLLSPIRVREDGVIERWNQASMDWQSTGEKYQASPYDVVKFIEDESGRFCYVLQDIYRCLDA